MFKLNKAFNLREKQEANLSSLLEIDKICRENNWTYFLAYGTLLGAIRHHGFIPWDDDVDIFMPRQDYDKLVEFMGDDIRDGFKLCTRENTENYPYYIPRFSNMQYRFVTTLNGPQFDIGAFVDVYPLDNYCNDKQSGMRLEKKLSLLNSLYAVYLNGAIGKSAAKKCVSRVGHFLLRSLARKDFAAKINKRMRHTLSKYTSDSDKYVGVPCWGAGIQYDKELFSETMEVAFEGHKLYVPKRYDEILTLVYNDYMSLPDVDARNTSHHYEMYVR